MPTSTAGKTVAAKKAKIDAAKMAAKMAAKPVTEVTGWKKATDGSPLEVPSGNVALVRPVGIQAFLTQGIIPNSLREMAMEAITKKKAPEMKPENLTSEQLVEMVTLFDTVTVYCVVEPRVHRIPVFTLTHYEAATCDPDEVGKEIPIGHPCREADRLYVDEVDLDDKAFIFAIACGGTRDLESFRAQRASGLELLSGVSDVEDSTE